MTVISERYKRLSDAFAAKVAAVPDDKWSSPSPCDGWSARDVVDHVVQTQGMFLGFIKEEVGELPADPVAAWDAARGRVQALLEEPSRATEEFDGMMGRTTFEDAVDKFLCTDLVVHNWDVSRAAGLDDTLEPGDLERVQNYMAPMGEALRSPGAFGPAVEVPADADEQTKVLAFLGRRD